MSLTLQVIVTTPNEPGDPGARRHPGAHRRHLGRGLPPHRRLAARARLVVVAHLPAPPQGTSRRDERDTHGSRVLSMAGGTLASRLTGLLRVLVLAWVLGFTPLADAFNLANTVPNMLFDLVLGGVAERDVHPGVRRAPRARRRTASLALDLQRRHRRAHRARGRVGARVVGAPWIIEASPPSTTAADSRHAAPAARRRDVAAALVRAPDLLLRRDRHRDGAAQHPPAFASAAWAPVANNVVCIARAGLVPPRGPHAHLTRSRAVARPPLAGPGHHRGGRGAVPLSRAVARAQRPVATLVPLRPQGPRAARDRSPRLAGRCSWSDQSALALRRAGLRLRRRRARARQRLHLRLVVHADALRRRGRLGAGGADPPAGRPVDRRRLRRARRTAALRAAPVAGDHHPCTLVLVVLAQPIVAILLNHLNATQPALAPGPCWRCWRPDCRASRCSSCACADCNRCSARARSSFSTRCRTPLTIALAVVLGRHSLAGLTASVSIAYSAAAVVALVALARHQVHDRRRRSGRARASKPRGVAGRGRCVMALAYRVTWATRGSASSRASAARSAPASSVYVVVVASAQHRVRARRRKVQG